MGHGERVIMQSNEEKGTALHLAHLTQSATLSGFWSIRASDILVNVSGKEKRGTGGEGQY